MSAADTVADLVGAMHAAVGAVSAAEGYWIRRRGSDPVWGTRQERLRDRGDHFLSVWTEAPEWKERPSGRIARRCRPRSALEAAGWRILPIPALYEAAELLGPRMGWCQKVGWVAIPPEGSGLKARCFTGPGHAQAWASEQLLASNALSSGEA